MATTRFCLRLAVPILTCIAFGVSLSLATIESVTIEPPEPDCNDIITLRMEGSFPDQCFTIDAVLLVQLLHSLFAEYLYMRALFEIGYEKFCQ